MDSIKGAIVLRERFENGTTPADPAAAAPAVSEDALPVFHWVAAGCPDETSLDAGVE